MNLRKVLTERLTKPSESMHYLKNKFFILDYIKIRNDKVEIRLINGDKTKTIIIGPDQARLR
jgi:septum formation topological specificity factor MinE